MESTLTIANVMALGGVMLIGAMVPSVSVLTVSARALSLGFPHGVATAMGIVAGDLLFILIAIYGLSILTEWLGDYFFLFRYLGGAYLIGLGLMLWRSKPVAIDRPRRDRGSLSASFLVGLAVTLADQKAVLFYLAFFPAFLDLAALTGADTATILVVATVAVGAPKLMYAYAAGGALLVLENAKATRIINIVAGAAMIGVGIYLVARA